MPRWISQLRCPQCGNLNPKFKLLMKLLNEIDDMKKREKDIEKREKDMEKREQDLLQLKTLVEDTKKREEDIEKREKNMEKRGKDMEKREQDHQQYQVHLDLLYALNAQHNKMIQQKKELGTSKEKSLCIDVITPEQGNNVKAADPSNNKVEDQNPPPAVPSNEVKGPEQCNDVKAAEQSNNVEEQARHSVNQKGSETSRNEDKEESSVVVKETPQLTSTLDANSHSNSQRATPLVKPKEPISLLREEYKNQNILTKITQISNLFRSWRRIRGDGNCWYSAFMVAVLEYYVNVVGILALLSKINAGLDLVNDLHLSCPSLQPAIDNIKSKLSKFDQGNPASLESCLNDNKFTLDFVLWLRWVTSACIRSKENFHIYVTEGTVDDYCHNNVEKMEVEGDQLTIMAIADWFGIGLKIIQLDRSDGPLPEYIYPTEAALVVCNMLFRPGHYDVLYQ